MESYPESTGGQKPELTFAGLLASAPPDAPENRVNRYSAPGVLRRGIVEC